MLKKLITIVNSEEFLNSLNNPEIWNSLDVDYFPPRVERLWRKLEIDGLEYRIYLHMIHFTEKPCLFHKHRWPSAIMMLEGGYEMGIAYSEENISSEDAYKLPVAARFLLSEGSAYEMTEPHGLHYVKPVTEYSISVMLSGPKYQNVEISEVLDRKLNGLEPQDIAILLKKVRSAINKM